MGDLLRTVLEGHDETLGWQDFQGAAPANPAGDQAQTEARFDFAYDYEWDDTKGDHHGYRVNHVQVKVVLDRASMWVVKGSKSAELLKHEQGHYDIVALVARDLYDELTGWETPKAPRRFKKETDLKSAADRLGRQAKALAARLAGTTSTVGVYDKQTNHGKDTQAQDKWDKMLESARSKGTKVMAGLGVLGVGAKP